MADVENSNGNIRELNEGEGGESIPRGQIDRARQDGKFKLPAIISPRPNFENGANEATTPGEGSQKYRGSTP